MHYYAGHFAETESDHPSDTFALRRMLDTSGLTAKDLESAALEGKYAMADYFSDGETVRIAFKDLGDDLFLAPEVREAAERRFRDWANDLGLRAEFVPYGQIFDAQ